MKISKKSFTFNEEDDFVLNNDKGFTLVETLVTIVIMSIVIATVFYLFTFTSVQYRNQQTKTYQMLIATSIEEFIKSELRYAINISDSTEQTGYEYLECKNDTLFTNNNVQIFSDTFSSGQYVDVKFNRINDYSLGVAINISNNSGIETKYDIVCKLLNMELYNETLPVINDSTKLVYKYIEKSTTEDSID